MAYGVNTNDIPFFFWIMILLQGGKVMQYVLLGSAIILEIIATTSLKYSEGFTRLFPAICCIISYILCFYLFSKALNRIDLGVAYATWCAGGIVVTSVISSVVFKQKLNMIGLVGIVLIVTGCIILNLFGSSNQ